MSDQLILILASIICFVFNEPLAEVIVDNMEIAQLKWLFGEKKWIMILRHYLIIWTRIVVYGAVLITMGAIIF